MRDANIGKIDLDTFTSFILPRLGRKDDTVIVPPRTGIDAAVIDIGHDNVLIIAEDPIFAVPMQPWEMFGWYTVHIGASDVAVMGAKPRYMMYSLLMPPETTEEDFKTIVNAIHEAALELDIAIVGGHTGRYPGFAAPTIGGVTVFAIVDKRSYVTPAGAKPGNDVILTKGPAIEAAAILSVIRQDELMERYPSSLVKEAQALCNQMTVVKDALLAMDAGGVTAMHDATEGGVIGGLFEIASASGVGMEIDEDAFVCPDAVRVVCEAFGIDPLAAIAEGSLLITAEPECSRAILHKLNASDIRASIVGKVTGDQKTRIIKRRDGTIASLKIPAQDPFWPVFFDQMVK
ncbi:MAG: AIR synthase family protein [Euryarchaeota archaeon]|nr:AIR synthase family protein [Euryarchaeota archaeon]